MYTVNGISIETFGIFPGRGERSNIALSGWLDMPKRLGKTFHAWDDEHAVEPYVAPSELFHEGRDLTFSALIDGSTKVGALAKAKAFYEQFDTLQLVPFGSSWGNFNVFIKDEISTNYVGGGWATLTATFREPIVAIPAVVPSGTEVTLQHIDGVKFESLGAFIVKIEDNFNRPKAKAGQATVYGREAFQVTKTDALGFNVELIFLAADAATMVANVNKLHALLSSPGIRQMQIDGNLRSVFNVAGFEVTDIVVKPTHAICRVSLPMLTAGADVPIDTSFMLDNNFNNIVSFLLEKFKI